MPSQTEMLARSADQMARRFADDACRAKHGHLMRAAIYATWFIEALKDGGLPEKSADVTDVKQVLGIAIDALSEAIGLVEKDADNHGIAPEVFHVDMADLLVMWRKLDDEPMFGDIRRLAAKP